ncbi:methyl-accepting chemotaxis protein [Dechloromonas sp. ARDL1]|uniref:methyl-accepting chemotaxis protein n=1 Tax=Dechloromonas sp. ARDL1 TaxID=3322121 RepID=UPI003DA714DD
MNPFNAMAEYPPLRSLYNVKIWIRLVVSIAAMLSLAWGSIIHWTAYQQRNMVIHQARDLATSVNQMTMANLLFMKVTKTIKKRHIYYDQVRQSEAIKDLRVLRGELVIHEMGDGDEIAMNPNELEKQVMASGKTLFQEAHDPKHGHVLIAIFPAIASKNYLGRDCMECHEEVKDGNILGAVSMKVSLEDLDESVAESRMGMLMATLMISVPLLLFVFIFVRSFVTIPLAAMAHNLKGIASGEGDLRSRLPIKGKDEVGEASTAFNAMMEKLQTLIAQINCIASRVANSAGELRSRTDNVAKGSEAQARESENAASALDEIATAVVSVNQSCAQVHQLTLESQKQTHEGQASLQQLQHQIKLVENAVGNIAEKVESFVTSTHSITKMTQEVKDIADQTNLLALNAAIEAARAGETGRGFAVVADEVRKLAEKSNRSAVEIDKLTTALGNESGQVRNALASGLEVLAASHGSMSAVANVLDNAAATVNQVAKGMTEVNDATEQQQQASGLVSAQVDAIASLARENGNAIQAMNESMQELNQLAHTLEHELSRFKI